MTLKGQYLSDLSNEQKKLTIIWYCLMNLMGDNNWTCLFAENVDCTSIRCRDGQTCLTEISTGRPRCVTCTYRCPRKRERIKDRMWDRDRDRDPTTTPLCATNNITYPSWCHIMKDACITGFVLETKHPGPCDAYDSPPIYIGKHLKLSHFWKKNSQIFEEV